MATNKTFDEHWQKIFDAQPEDFRIRSITEKVLSLIKDGNLIEAGCGSGYLAVRVALEGREVLAIDLSESMISMCKKYARKNNINPDIFCVLSINDLSNLYQDSFDNAVCLDVLEHIEDDYTAYQNIISTLKPGGKAIISVPAIPYLYGPKDEKIGHFRRYSKQSFTQLLRSQDVTIESIQYWNIFGVLPTLISIKLLGKEIDETFRHSDNEETKSSLINSFLLKWFLIIENNITPPIGLTLLAVIKSKK